MAPKQARVMKVNETEIRLSTVGGQDYISLTDMVRNNGGNAVLEKWLRNKNTIEYLGIWESLNNSNFNSLEFGGIKNQAGTNRFVLSVKQWIKATLAIGIRAQAGRYGGTYAHQDIAFEFASYLSPQFKLYLIKEFQRLKAETAKLEQWNYRRFLSKVNYKLQTKSVQEVLLPAYDLPKMRQRAVYAEEADILNLAVFGLTAKDWRDQKVTQTVRVLQDNIRDEATIEQLTVLANLESLNSMLINEGADKLIRFDRLHAEAERQLRALMALQQSTNRSLEPGS